MFDYLRQCRNYVNIEEKLSPSQKKKTNGTYHFLFPKSFVLQCVCIQYLYSWTRQSRFFPIIIGTDQISTKNFFISKVSIFSNNINHIFLSTFPTEILYCSQVFERRIEFLLNTYRVHFLFDVSKVLKGYARLLIEAHLLIIKYNRSSFTNFDSKI